MGTNRVPAYVGKLVFDKEFSNPVVDVEHEFRTVDHEIITPDDRGADYAVQLMGRKPANITVEGYIYEDHDDGRRGPLNLERLLRSDIDDGPREPVHVRTERWWGWAIPEQIDVVEQRERRDGKRLYEVTLDLREVFERLGTFTQKSDFPGVVPDTERKLPDFFDDRQTAGSEFRTDTPQGELKNFANRKLYAPLVTDPGEIPDALVMRTNSGPIIPDVPEQSPTFVGRLQFRKRFSNPTVDISVAHNYKENNLLGSQLGQTDEFDATSTGIEPPTITINGVITERQVRAADLLGRAGLVLVQTNTWQGTAAVSNVRTTDRREIDQVYGEWLHDITIDLKSVVEEDVLLPATVPRRSVPNKVVEDAIIDVDKQGEPFDGGDTNAESYIP